MPVIDPKNNVVTHINVFRVSPEKQQELIDSLIETTKAAKQIPGWLSSSVHKSYDGEQVVNYVQFESQEAAQAVGKQLLAQGHIQSNTLIGDMAPGQYEVVYVAEISEG